MTFYTVFFDIPLWHNCRGWYIMIKEYRIKNNYTQEQLAEIINISPRQLQRIEKNEDKTKIETIKKIIKVLSIPDEEILKYIKNS